MSDFDDLLEDLPTDPLERAMALRNGLVSHSEGGSIDSRLYVALRRELMSVPVTAALLPQFVRTCRTTSDFWAYIKELAPRWEPRRQHVRAEFEPLLTFLDRGSTSRRCNFWSAC